MALSQKVNDWLKENIPTLAKVFDNKYLNMAYDRYASLPPKQQKMLAGAAVGSVVFIILGYLFVSYLSLWSANSTVGRSAEMISMLREHQKVITRKGGEVEGLERGNQLGAPGALKGHLVGQARIANISPRMIVVEEKEGPSEPDAKASADLRLKQATVKLNRVNLNQLKGFLEAVEFGAVPLSISSLRVRNDDQLRGYLNVELGIVAYLFQNSQPTGGQGE